MTAVEQTTVMTMLNGENILSPSDHDDDIINHSIFDQLLGMDDGDDHEFSRALVWDFFEQAEGALVEMDQAMTALDFTELSRLGHFLKGSSAALGLTKVKLSCERLQHYGNLTDETGKNSITEEEAKTLSLALLVQMRSEYKEAEVYLREFYESQEDTESQ
ncbi:osomolarity two-component system, phosphorelay intermediate protein YPD1 [Entomortierella parvispora]|uniref:Osomolarity two-component system, phosphorelay intermediate protein YPD1 n=1 Tax=Entomortierella parvispora TaxID=205924 RepID=A0A9P3HHE1_9FUNG|nr:osomolarity two-component system, phosphorelay intermediate protein YPD1 [Entomortierella parvispora]